MKKTESAHSKHLWLMAICCGVPILGFLLMGSLGFSSPSLELLFAVVCPIGMGAMMFMMAKNSGQNNRSCRQTQSEQGKTSHKPQQISNGHGSTFIYKGRFQGKTGRSFKSRKKGKLV
ncbi:MAG: hypothetical protein HN580_09825 [Deltaproteobacteria bacterium]|jgi:hypothetical protein|nr:hypothetical protein [Deltaproteobacteria bacterium]MBT4087628.1 hypothetical protein [Deltaproteobacteria bacterium]MBT4263252.1 hypothetical protein [Deltaproteobacteria bacterium]MBT4639027.1 hypothetical protein [Deltaproteobacteria bacterium]MBT6502275.1 hypothetical protein [Deltaproteobacteria bacterium]